MKLYVTLLYISKFPVNVLSYFHNLKNKKETEKKKSPQGTWEKIKTLKIERKKKNVSAMTVLIKYFFKCLESITHALLGRSLWNHNNMVELSTGIMSVATPATEDV